MKPKPFFPITQKIAEIDRKIKAIEKDVVWRKHSTEEYVHSTLGIWRAIAADYRAAQATMKEQERADG